MSAASFKITGFKELDKAINKLPKELKRKAYRSVLSTGARIIAKNAKKHIHDDSGLLRKSIGIKVIYKNTDSPRAYIGSKTGETLTVDGREKKATHYAKNVEQGTAHTAAKPFMRPAVDGSRNDVMVKMTKGLTRFLARAAKKLETKGRY